MSTGEDKWVIPPGPASSTGVPKPEWYDQPYETWPPAAKQWAKLYAEAMHNSAVVEGIGQTVYELSQEGPLPTDRQQLIELINDRLMLKGFKATFESGWKYLEPQEKKTFVMLYAEIFDVDLIAYPGGRLEFRYPRQLKGTGKRTGRAG